MSWIITDKATKGTVADGDYFLISDSEDSGKYKKVTIDSIFSQGTKVASFTTSQMNSLSVQDRTVVFNITEDAYYFYNGSTWERLTITPTQKGAINLLLTGNI